MPGALGRLDLLPPEEFDVIDDSLSTAVSAAMTDLAKKGVIAAGRTPSTRGEMPTDFTSLDDDKLGNLLNELSQWCGYLDTELMKAGALKKQAETHLEKVQARVRLALKVDEEGKRLTDKDKDDRTSVDPRVVEATRREIYHYTLYVVLKGIRDEAQKNWDTVSRRITQRTTEQGRQRRDVNVAGVPLQGRTFRRPT